jgi:hypothetical protein
MMLKWISNTVYYSVGKWLVSYIVITTKILVLWRKLCLVLIFRIFQIFFSILSYTEKLFSHMSVSYDTEQNSAGNNG